MSYRCMLLMSPLLLLLGCGETSGPCIHEYEDPVVTITEVTDGKTGAQIEEIVVVAAEVDGQAVDDLSRLTMEPAFGVAVTEEGIACAVSCGFGTSEGAWSLAVAAAGYESKIVPVNAQYQGFEGGCPSRNFGPTQVQFELERQS